MFPYKCDMPAGVFPYYFNRTQAAAKQEEEEEKEENNAAVPGPRFHGQEKNSPFGLSPLTLIISMNCYSWLVQRVYFEQQQASLLRSKKNMLRNRRPFAHLFVVVLQKALQLKIKAASPSATGHELLHSANGKSSMKLGAVLV